MESHRQQYLRHMVSYGDLNFDPTQGLLKLSENRKRDTGDENFCGGVRHAVHESLDYALVLLELAERSLQGRAEAIISRVMDLQESGPPAAKTYGVWPQFLGTPVKMSSEGHLDLTNLNGMTLLLIWHRHRRRLRPAMVEKIVQGLVRTRQCVSRGNSLSYANLIVGVFVLLSGAEIAGDEKSFADALKIWSNLNVAMAQTSECSYSKSPEEMALCLVGLHAIQSYVRDERARALTEQPLTRIWIEVAQGLQRDALVSEVSRKGPCFDSLHGLAEILGPLIGKASRGAVSSLLAKSRNPFAALYACLVDGDAPAGAVAALSSLASPPRKTTTHYRERVRVNT